MLTCADQRRCDGLKGPPPDHLAPAHFVGCVRCLAGGIMRQHHAGDRRPTGRLLHYRIRERAVRALAGRSWAWLASEAGIPQSTLSTQLAKPKFSVETLCRIARVLELDLNDLLLVPTDRRHP